MVPGLVSIIIPGRKEKFFQKTVESALDSASGEIEIIAIVDGEEWETPLVCEDSRVKIIRLEKSIGQRESYNLGVSESNGEYVMKIDAHCLLSKGFDIVLKEICKDKMTVIPEMKRLNPHEWMAKKGGETLHMYFGLDMYCHYWSDYAKREDVKKEYAEVLTGQGSCWFCKREWNDYIGLLNPEVGSWGNVGIEVSLRTWLCGGTQISTNKVWQAHYFRKDEGGFPYHITGRNVKQAHDYTWNNYYFNDNAFKNQIRPFRWLIEKFSPIPGWEAYSVDYYKSPRVIVYYTDSNLDERIFKSVIKKLDAVKGLIPVYSVSQKPLKFGNNICIGEQPRKYKSVYEAMLKGVEAVPDNSIVYLCEHDVYYHPSHFAFLPPENGTLYFNTNRYYTNDNNDTFLKAKGNRALSQCVAHKEDLIIHAKERLSCESEITETWDELTKRTVLKFREFESRRPNIDVLHENNLTLKGSVKKGFVNNKIHGIKNCPGWGSVGHFRKNNGGTKYIHPVTKDDSVDNVSDYLHNRYNNGQISPIRVVKMTRVPDISKLFNRLGFKTGAEIGVKFGDHSNELCKYNPELKLYCIDPWGEYSENDNKKMNLRLAEKCYSKAVKTLSKYNVEIIREESLSAVKRFEDNSLDFVYIDANHVFDAVMMDLIMWSKKVKPGGIVSGHDYFRFRNAGVVPAVDVYTYQHGIYEWFITDEKAPSFFWAKPKG